MNTMESIKNELLTSASTANLTGLSIDALCSLLAYSIYKNQMLQARLNLEGSFTTSTSLNSRIHHASNLLFSVSRGHLPYISVDNCVGTETIVHTKLEEAFTYNGYYFYYRNDTSFEKNAPFSSLEYICSSQRKQACTVTSEQVREDIFFLDFLDENISEDCILYYEVEGERVFPSTTSDVNSFYGKRVTETGEVEYIYDYLLITIPSYGVRLMRHSDSSGWGGATSFTLEYLPYSESVPDFSNLRSIPGVQFSTSDSGEVLTTLQVHGYEERMESLERIYAQATENFHAQGTVATIYDLIAMLQNYDPIASFRVYNDSKFTGEMEAGRYPDPHLNDDPLTTTIFYSGSPNHTAEDFEAQLSTWRTSLSVTKVIEVHQAQSHLIDDTTVPTVYVTAVSDTMSLTNEMLRQITDSYQSKIGETITHSDLEAEVIRLGFNSVKTYYSTDGDWSSSLPEWTDDVLKIEAQPWEYPALNAYVSE